LQGLWILPLTVMVWWMDLLCVQAHGCFFLGLGMSEVNTPSVVAGW